MDSYQEKLDFYWKVIQDDEKELIRRYPEEYKHFMKTHKKVRLGVSIWKI